MQKLFLSPDTIKIIVLGLIAFSIGTATGVIFGKIMCKATRRESKPTNRFSRSISSTNGS